MAILISQPNITNLNDSVTTTTSPSGNDTSEKYTFPGDCIENPCDSKAGFGCERGSENTHYCICTYSGEYMKDENSICVRKTVIHTKSNNIPIIPNGKKGSRIILPPYNLTHRGFPKEPPIIGGGMESVGVDEIIKEVEVDPSNFELLTSSPTFELALMAVSFIVLICMLVLCCRKKGCPSMCFSKSAKAKKKNRTIMEQNMMSTSVNKSLLDGERYTSNPLYTSASVTSTDNLPFPTIPRENVSFDNEIGEGCFGKVFKGELFSNGATEVVAIKVLKDNASQEYENDFMREVEIMSSFRHENILSLLGVVPKEPGKKPWMVFEFMTHGDLAEVLRRNSGHFIAQNPNLPILSKDQLLVISKQIAAGMKYLADQRFVHRDLACRNCLVGNNLSVKIADFGMSRDVYTCDYYKVGGARHLPVRWMSPESVMYGRFTLESDVWSYGVILWEIYSLGKQPYFGHSNEEVMKLIIQGIMLIPPDNCPRAICEIMSMCWKTEPRDRITFSEISKRLNHTIQEEEENPLPRPPALPIATDHLSTLHRHGIQYDSNDMLDEENYLQPHCDVHPPGDMREYIQALPS